MQPRLDSPQPLLYVDTSGSHPLSYPTPLYGPIPVSGSPYYPNHGPGIPPYPGLPRQQTPSQQGSSSPFRHSPMANLYGLPPGGPNRYPPSNPNHSHSHSLNHSPIPPPTQPPSAYPGAYSPMYPHLYGGMSEYAQGPPYPYWNGHGFAMPGTQSPPYAPPMMPYAPPHIPVHIAPHSQPIDPRPSSLSPDEAIQVQLPPPTMIDHPPPPEESQPVAGYRDVRPVLIGSVAHQANGRSSEPSASVVFGSIDIYDVNNPLSPGPPARTPSSSSSQSSRKEATSQPDASDQLRSAFTAFTIGVSPNDPAPPRMRSRTRSGHSLSDASLSSTTTKQGTSQLAENTTQADKDVVDLTDGTETKWQFGTTNALPPQSETDTDSQLVLETPSTTGLKLPPLPLDLQPTPNMIATDHQPPPVDYDAALGEEFAVKNFGYGFGMIANNGYPLYVQEEPMMRDRPREQDFRDDRARWRDENEVERGGRGGVRDRENKVGTTDAGDGEGIAVTPPHHYQQLMTYNDIPNGYYPPQVPQHQSPINFVPPVPPGGYETYIPQPQQPLPPPAGPIHATPPVPEPITHIGFPLDLVRRYLLGQMEYYMSPQNMSKDFYLRQQMDSRGWIPISVFASFKRVMALTADINLVRDVLILSSIVEVREDWVRMRDWEQFVLPGATPSLIEAAEPLAQPAKSSSHIHDVHDDNEGDVDDEDEEEDVVFVIDDESQRWSPDRRQT
ncbi:hypothetical protein ONZ45_g16610 [Pleurotus djamor]|nr:hypothetical protein ONZ45_g16610 [Pleurotus djamor]